MTARLPVTLFDYGVGNLHSLTKALERGGAQVTVTRDPDVFVAGDSLALPGVGAFGACMEPLDPVRDRLRDRLLGGTPCLAVCIGMQLLFEGSDESPGVAGLGVFRGQVRRFARDVGKVPHMGWNEVAPPQALPVWDDRSGRGLGWPRMLPGRGAHVYYVHSYYAAPEEPVTLLSTTYGVEFAAVVARGNTLATQFHPEKSSRLGLAVIDGWVHAARAHLEADADTPKA